MKARSVNAKVANPAVFLMVCMLFLVGPVAPLQGASTDGALPKSLTGSNVVFDPITGGAGCWQPETTQVLCFKATSHTPDMEFAENLWLRFPQDWVVEDVFIMGTPICDDPYSHFGPFAWSFHTPSHEVNIDHEHWLNQEDSCRVSYCVEITTGPGAGDTAVSWYWAGDGFGSTPHHPCSDDGYTPSGQAACDESLAPQAVLHDCTTFGQLEGTVLDQVGGGPVCTSAHIEVTPSGHHDQADGSGSYGPFDLPEGLHDVTVTAEGFEEMTANGVAVTPGSITVQDFDLVRPVAGVSATTFEATANLGDSAEEILTLSNLGVSPALVWSLSEPPQVPPANPLSVLRRIPGIIEVEPGLQAAMDSRGEAGYTIEFGSGLDLSPALKMEWEGRGRFVVDQLRAAAENSQARVRTYLDKNKVPYRSFWINNVIVVPASRVEVFDGLLGFEEITLLRTQRTVGLIEPEGRKPSTAAGRAVEPNLSHVKADQVWTLGIDGAGLIVANIDTGVRYTHETLVEHYRGNLGNGAFDHDYNWLNGGSVPTAAPEDSHGHGTHTMGTMVGDDGGANQVGMAPGAKWIACNAFGGDGSGTEEAILTCGQWITAPYPVDDPSSPDPARRPHIVNNSWGDCDQFYDPWYQDVVDAWHAAGIYPLFANGNASNCGWASPPGCNTVANPGRYGNVTGVGSTGQADGQYATHSNWGPTDNPDPVNPGDYPNLKPQVVAPGVDIRSALNGSDSDYASWGGTSMSTPHVAGLVALMWQAGPCLVGDYAQTETLLETTAAPVPYTTQCGGEPVNSVPNMATGWGEIDAYDAVMQASAYCNTDWLPWLSFTPVAGEVASGGAEDATLTFVCGGSAADESGTLHLFTNDPCAETTEISVSLHCAGDGSIFSDGFEDGTMDAWSASVP